MSTITFLHPEALWAVPAALVLFALWRLRLRRTFVAFSAVRWLKSLRHRPSPFRRLPLLVGWAALLVLTVAMMDPALPYSEAEVRSQGLDIALVLDLSSSMQETMDQQRGQPVRAPFASGSAQNPRTAKPAAQGRTRLEVTKAALRDFVRRREDDRIGIVVFSDNAYVVSPLTFDYDYLLHYIDLVDEEILRGEGMTAIGDGIGLASYLLVKQSTTTDQARNKLIVVFTDGEHNYGRDPVEALNEADAAAIRVHVIGVDLEEEVKKKPAVMNLISTVQRLGGRYYNADTVRQLRAAYSDIDTQEKGLLASKAYIRNAPVFDWFAWPAIALLLAAVVIRAMPFFADFT